jgi:hypothetical protein
MLSHQLILIKNIFSVENIPGEHFKFQQNGKKGQTSCRGQRWLLFPERINGWGIEGDAFHANSRLVEQK